MKMNFFKKTFKLIQMGPNSILVSILDFKNINHKMKKGLNYI